MKLNRTIESYRGAKPEAIAAGSPAQILFALVDMRHDVLVLADALKACQARAVTAQTDADLEWLEKPSP
jgi:hypothetical protein